MFYRNLIFLVLCLTLFSVIPVNAQVGGSAGVGSYFGPVGMSGNTYDGSDQLKSVNTNGIINPLSYGVNAQSGFTSTTTTAPTTTSTIPVTTLGALSTGRWAIISGNNGPPCGQNYFLMQGNPISAQIRNITCNPSGRPSLSATYYNFAGNDTGNYDYYAVLVDGVGGSGTSFGPLNDNNGPATIAVNTPVQVCLTSGQFGTDTPSNWSANTVYSLGQAIKPSSGNAGNKIFRVVTAGTGGNSAPTWTQSAGAMVVDGTATLQEVNATSIPVPMWALYRTTHGSAESSDVLVSVSNSACAVDTNLATATDFNYPANSTLGGTNENLRSRIVSSDSNTIIVADTPKGTIPSGATVQNDDAGMLQLVFNAAVKQLFWASNFATVSLPCPIANPGTSGVASCAYRVSSPVIISGGNTKGISWKGTGGFIAANQVHGPALIVGDTYTGDSGCTTNCDATGNIYFDGISITGSGATGSGATNHPQQDGLFIGAAASTGTVEYANSTIQLMPHIAILGDKNGLTGGVWDNVVLRNDVIASIGYSGIMLGMSHGIDVLTQITTVIASTGLQYSNSTGDAGWFGSEFIRGGGFWAEGENQWTSNSGSKNNLHLQNVAEGTITGRFEANKLLSSGRGTEIVCDSCGGLNFVDLNMVETLGCAGNGIQFTATNFGTGGGGSAATNNVIDSLTLASTESNGLCGAVSMISAVDFNSQANNVLRNLCAYSSVSLSCSAGPFSSAAIINNVSSDAILNVPVGTVSWQQPRMTLPEVSTPAGLSAYALLYDNSSSHRLMMNYNNLGAQSVGGVVASGTSALATGTLSNGTCASVVTTAATGALATDAIEWSHNAAITAATNGMLTIHAWPTTNNVNFQECNSSGGSITPPADTLNWSVLR